MGKTLDEIEQAFIETPVKRLAKPKGNLLVAKTKPLQGVSSWKLLRELSSRHYVDMQVFGFWLALAILIWVKLGR